MTDDTLIMWACRDTHGHFVRSELCNRSGLCAKALDQLCGLQHLTVAELYTNPF